MGRDRHVDQRGPHDVIEALPPDLGAWLSPFPPEVQEAVAGAADVVGPAALDIGLDPVGAIRRLSEDVAAVAPGDDVAWLVDQREPGALSEVELEALFSELAHLEALAVVAGDEPGRSRFVAVARRRQDVVGVVLRLPEDRRSWRRAVRELRLLPEPVALVAMTSPEAVGLRRLRARRLRRILVEKDIGLLLHVPTERTEIALRDLPGEAAPLVRIAGDRARVRAVRFDEASRVITDGRFGDGARAAAIDIDLSLSPPGTPGEPAAHLFGGAYLPQPFDQRSPSARHVGDRPLELVRAEFQGLPLREAIASLVLRRRGWAVRTLARRLSFRRRERYFQRAAASLDLQQRYHDHVVYNWPPQEPATRVWAVDLGSADAERLRTLTEEWEVAAPAAGLVGHGALIEAAREEALRRVAPSPGVRLEEQLSFHDYLASIPAAGPLREDLEHFVDFVPAELGRVVELGSGFGQLALELQARASTYLALDISLNAQRAVAMAGGTTPVLGDMHHLPFATGSVDTVLANNALEHLYDPAGGLAEVARVLRPGGRLLALIPLELLGPRHDLPAHLWKTDERGIRAVVDAAGLRVHRLEVLDIYRLGVAGSFPSCSGLVAELEAVR